MSGNRKIILGITAILAVVLLTIAATVAVANAVRTPPEATIPAAAAAEANLVCTSFQGLQSFVVQAMPPASSPEGDLAKYRVQATCKSEHVITGVIGLAEKASQ